MWHMRPGTRVRFWSPKYKHRPGVEPPVLLRLLASLSIFSIIGVLVYGVSVALTAQWSTMHVTDDAPYIAVLHLVLPFCVFYTVSTNSWLSRPLIVIYFAALYGATMLGKGFLGGLELDPNIRGVVATGVFVVILAWLFRSPAMRIYYLLLADRLLPEELAARARQLAERQSPHPKVVAAMEWFVDHLETLVMVGFIILVIYAWANQSSTSGFQ